MAGVARADAEGSRRIHPELGAEEGEVAPIFGPGSSDGIEHHVGIPGDVQGGGGLAAVQLAGPAGKAEQFWLGSVWPNPARTPVKRRG